MGIGAGGPVGRTLAAIKAIEGSHVILGYKRYVELIADIIDGQEVVSSGMTREVERCRQALRLAAEGKTVSLISSGDPGIYGMAGLAIEVASKEGFDVPIEIIPGVTAASAAAARLGAPLMLDCAFISLSDILVPWQEIARRLEKVASADLVTVLYNPKSKERRSHIEEARAIFGRYRSGSTPVGIGTSLGAEDEEVVLTDLDHFLEHDMNMRSIVIIGNSTSKKMDKWFVTPRGYSL